jgi:hypothetical protein
MRALTLALGLAVTLGLAESTYAQGRGFRGPPEAVRARGGSYFVDVTLPAASDDVTSVDRLATTEHVKKAAEEGQLSLLYLFDPEGDQKKHERFETTLLNQPNLNVALKAFKCGIVSLTPADTESDYGRKAPLFVVFDAKGNCVGEASMHGYKTSAASLISLLNRAAKGHAKVSLPAFVKQYRDFLNDLTQLEGRKDALKSKRARLENKDGTPNPNKLAKLDKDDAELQKAEEKLLESEKEILESAKIPPRDGQARRVGERSRGRGR